jgi:hypothetical protein
MPWKATTWFELAKLIAAVPRLISYWSMAPVLVAPISAGATAPDLRSLSHRSNQAATSSLVNAALPSGV